MKFFHTLKRWQRIALVVALVALVLAAVFLLTGRETPAQEPQNLAVSLTPSAATDAPTEPAAQTPSQASTEAAAEPPGHHRDGALDRGPGPIRHPGHGCAHGTDAASHASGSGAPHGPSHRAGGAFLHDLHLLRHGFEPYGSPF